MRIGRRGPRLALAGALCVAAAAFASDEKKFAELKARYDKASKNHDDTGIRERRRILGECIDYLDQKACRKLVREAFDADDAVDTRVAAVRILGATGDPKDLDAIVKGLAKDKLRGPTIAVGEGITYTAKDAAAAQSVHAMELAAKAKGDLRFALLEGVGILGDPAAYDALAAFSDKLLPDEHFVRDAALGACGREKAVAALTPDAKAPSAVIRFGAVTGLARSGAPGSFPILIEALHDLDGRVMEAAAVALGHAKHQPAAGALADAMSTATLRTKFALRTALVAIVGKDYGFDPAAWHAAILGKTPEPAVVAAGTPKLPEFFGVPVASDRVAVVLDLSHSMGWSGRIARAEGEIAQFLASLDDSVVFSVYGVARTTERSTKNTSSGAASRDQAIAWVKKLLPASGFNLKAGLLQVLDEQPDADTLLLATDSLPWGDGSTESAMEALEVFRRANVTRHVRLIVALVVPGGRVAASETEDEYDDRSVILQQMAENDDSGGKFVRIDK